MKKEDIKFLVNLKNEIQTQENYATRPFLIWRIRYEYRIYNVVSEDSDGWLIFDGEDTYGTSDEGIDKIAEKFIKDYPDGYKEYCDDYDDDLQYCCSPEELIEIMNEVSGHEFSLTYYHNYITFDRDTYFLTKKECDEYLKRYSYKFQEWQRPYSYCVHLEDRCNEMNRLLHILMDTDWEKEEEL